MRTSLLPGAMVVLLSMQAGAVARAADAAPPPLRIDVPVKLESAKVVFNMDHLAFQGDLPVGMKYMALVADRMSEQQVKASLVAVFHGEAGYMLLDDAAYDRVRKVSTGNPYKAIVASLLAKGIQLEACAVTMKGNGWGNADLLPGVKVDTGAVIRLVQLQQQGYAEIHP